MRYITDLHLHSKYSRAVSQDMALSTMSRMGRVKGLDILSAADWTHPLWFKEIQAQLVEVEEGMYSLKSEVKEEKKIHFVLSTEIASIYKDKEKLRRIHNLVLAPNFAIAERINKALLARGANLSSDGRPIIGLSSRNLLEIILSISEDKISSPLTLPIRLIVDKTIS